MAIGKEMMGVWRRLMADSDGDRGGEGVKVSVFACFLYIYTSFFSYR